MLVLLSLSFIRLFTLSFQGSLLVCYQSIEWFLVRAYLMGHSNSAANQHGFQNDTVSMETSLDKSPHFKPGKNRSLRPENRPKCKQRWPPNPEIITVNPQRKCYDLLGLDDFLNGPGDNRIITELSAVN
jgi:hypothetical protein